MENPYEKSFSSPVYAGFWARFGASFFDGIIVSLICMPIEYFTFKHSPTAEKLGFTIAVVFSLSYQIFCHGKWGQTPGKMIAYIKVTKPDHKDIGFPKAFLRSSVDILIQAVSLYATVLAISLVPETATSLGWTEHKQLLGKLTPQFLWIGYVSMVWYMSEAFIMLTNYERRSLHDFIAGTVVIRVRNQSK